MTQKEWINHIPEVYRNVYIKAMEGKSMRAAINAKCQDCCCWQRNEVRDCPHENCPLFKFRPYQRR